MPKPHSRYRRSALDLSRGQTGDVTTGDSIGGDVYHYGLDPTLARYLEGERNSRDAMATAVIRLHEDLAELRREARERDQDAALERGIDFEARLKRQAQLDADLLALRRWLTSLTLAILAVALVLAAVVWYELALFGRALFDTAGPALARWRAP